MAGQGLLKIQRGIFDYYLGYLFGLFMDLLYQIQVNLV